MDNQDTMQLAEVLESRTDVEEEKEEVIIFFALKGYLSHLTNNGGKLKRIIQVTKMLESRVPEIIDYYRTQYKES